MAPDGQVMAVPITPGPRFTAGLPVPLFKARVADIDVQFGRDYVPSADGQRFLINSLTEDRPGVRVMVNWSVALKK